MTTGFEAGEGAAAIPANGLQANKAPDQVLRRVGMAIWRPILPALPTTKLDDLQQPGQDEVSGWKERRV